MIPPTYEAPPICDPPLLQRSPLTHLGSFRRRGSRTSEARPPGARPAPPHLHSALPSRTPSAAPPPQAPPRVPAPSFRLARAAWAERAVLSGGTAGGVHWLPSTRPSAVSGLFAMDRGAVPSTPRTSFRTFLEHLSGAGKAIGVLTSGGDAQGALPPPRAGAEGDIGEKGWRYQGERVGTPGKRQGYGEKRDVGEQPNAREPQGTCTSKSLRGREGKGMAALASLRKIN